MIRFILWFFILLATPLSASAALSVFTCEPEWAALVQEVGGKQVKVVSATTSLQDPHHIQARPSLIARVRKADLVVCTGAGLEIGWLPLLLRRAGNPRVQSGQPAYFEAAGTVTLLERPQRLDRAAGDVHAAGNPHIQMDPYRMATVAKALAQRLSTIDSSHATQYQGNLKEFLARWESAISRWEKKAAPLRGMKVVVQHRSWVYLGEWLGLERVAALEPKPGIPPSSGDLARLLAQFKRQPVEAIIRAAYQDKRGAHWLSSHSGIAEVELPFTVGGTEQAQNLFSFFDDTINRLLAVLP